MIIATRIVSSLLLLAMMIGDSLAAPPDVVDPQIETLVPGVTLTLVAEHPDVVTPTGIDVDERDRLWFVCSHTHFRPEDYDGPEHDEIVVRSPDGTRRVFYNKTDATMDLELGDEGWVYLTERDRVLRVRDTDGDGVGDLEQDIAVLKTDGDYPHNGLSGMAWDQDGNLVFALGENFWKEWTLTGTDDSSVSGTGEGGIFRCKPDGTQLRRIAKGFWNPFGICVRSDGTIFAGENDPGSRPPCRLLHVVEGGDYGYQRSYGNAPHHPFVCWDGELRGTLPMLFSVGEAPCGIAPLGNGLLVTSWTDHRIDFYPLKSKGASYETDRVSLVSGSLHFRPTCIVQKSPTVFYLTDWVFGSYALHKKGRLWKLEIDPTADKRFGPQTIPAANDQAKLADKLRSGGAGIAITQILKLAKSDDPFIARAALDALAMRVDEFEQQTVANVDLADQVSFLLAIRKAEPKNARWVKYFIQQSDQQLKFEALRWIADERLESFLPDVVSVFSQPQLDYRIFEAALAARNTLAGDPRKGVIDKDVLLEQVLNKNATSRARAFALRLIDPNDKKLARHLIGLAAVDDDRLLREVVQTLATSDLEGAQALLQSLIPKLLDQPSICADAVAGLKPAEDTAGILDELETVSNPIREEALRVFRFYKLNEDQKLKLTSLNERFPGSSDLVDAIIDPSSIVQDRPKPSDVAAWRERLSAIDQPVDVEAGRRIFYHRRVGACAKCHRHSGRGRVVGPDLSAASNRGDPDRLLKALLEPSRDVDPQYFPRTIVTEDGESFTGIMLRDGGGGKEFYRDSAGHERMFKTDDIVTRKELRVSMMPDGLIDTLTDREIRDVLAFLDHDHSSEAN